MEYREFLENVRKEVESRYDSNVSVTLNHVMKNNGTELDGITIMEKDKNIAPTIYINSFYDRYREGVSLKAVVSEIIRIYNQNKNSININADYFENYENVRKTIVYKLVNYQKNKKLLEKYFPGDFPPIAYSALTGEGREELLKVIEGKICD